MDPTEETKKDFLAECEIFKSPAPAWAEDLFQKMKDEICAEVHAKVAYTVKIMLNQMKQEIILSLSNKDNDTEAVENPDDCSCKDGKRCRVCKGKWMALRAANDALKKEEKAQYHALKKEEKAQYYALKKEEKKLKKVAYKETKKCHSKKHKQFSGSDSDVELIQIRLKQFSPDPSVVNEPPPVPPRKVVPTATEVVSEAVRGSPQTPETNQARHTIITLEEEPKIMNNSPCNSIVLQNNIVTELVELEIEQFPSLVKREEKLPFKIETTNQPSPSDSEFEVVSMPPANHMPEYSRMIDNNSGLSDFGNSQTDSVNSDEEQSEETELEFKDCSQVASGHQHGDFQTSTGSLYPELELKKMKLSMTSSSSTFVDGYMSSCSNNEPAGVAESGEKDSEAAAVVYEPIERQTAHYSFNAEQLNVLCTDSVVNSQPLPSEFFRDRRPYSQAHVGQREHESNNDIPAPAQQPQQPTQHQQSQQQQQQQQQHDSKSYRVDNLPENLWDEALTVAAQTYNAAKTAVGNLAETFVPVVNKPTLNQPTRAAPPTNPVPVPPRVTPAPRYVNPTAGMTVSEHKLYDMGFTDRALNATLLSRYNYDIEKVVASLLDP